MARVGNISRNVDYTKNQAKKVNQPPPVKHCRKTCMRLLTTLYLDDFTGTPGPSYADDSSPSVSAFNLYLMVVFPFSHGSLS